MRPRKAILASLATGGVVIVAGIRLGLPDASMPTPAHTAAPEVDTESAPAKAGKSNFFTKRSSSRPLAASGDATSATATHALVNGVEVSAEWELRLAELLRSDVQPSERGRQLLEMLPQLPPAGRLQALRRAAEMLPDDGYAPLNKMLSDPETPADELDALMRDLLHRPDSLKLPALLTVARTGEHPYRGDARDILAVVLGEDFEEDWSTWEKVIAAWVEQETENLAADAPESPAPTERSARSPR
ncbi:MAG: hypothetical protein KIS67_21315 [Verrucomicrobiae bacterium]|nr:hypothetical protein [Verrucomicrobiae bacterium]